ncbi:hypothetical protein H257_15676 [Aphanomyces astaci]|uniref:Core-binding (CB) domain-containing protein n=1 Tax=Aphanomyces astaci TaxID=112090 RepID=W4FLJ3_APHAT|nr:hypothetical protein H257_15676 [Aphanomyces astaci]ETV68355.1 hypothetical protein H257_15676 [Aphanomyces astaci]|eukprot:XP_009842150.1 hypothetical protein H257_15676 [Aphanomyces astaci]
MAPTKLTTVASKKTIQDSFHGASTRRAYETYHNQFVAFLKSTKRGAGPREAGTVECTDFFHHMYTQGRKSRIIDLAKSALVAYFAPMRKYNKQHNVDEDRARAIDTHERSGAPPPFRSYRISEVLTLRWNDVDIVGDANGRYLSVRLRWHKKVNMEEDCQVYHLVDEMTFRCLRVCGFYDEHIAKVRNAGAGVNISSSTFVFPNFVDQQSGRTPILPIAISLHSLRRGGTFFRVFESKERHFNFRELMAWCRWADAKTCCEYLITQSISKEIDPRNLLRTGSDPSHIQWQTGSVAVPVGLGFSVDDLGQALAKNLHGQVPTARSALEAWQQWFVADPAIGLVCALKDYTKEMIRMDRKKYSERITLGTAFSKYQT